jgi:hypothetical protein
VSIRTPIPRRRGSFATLAAAARVAAYVVLCTAWVEAGGLLLWTGAFAGSRTSCGYAGVGRYSAFAMYTPGWVQFNVRHELAPPDPRGTPPAAIRAGAWTAGDATSLADLFVLHPKAYVGGRLGPIRYGRWNLSLDEFRLYSLLAPAWVVWLVYMLAGVPLVAVPMLRRTRRRRRARAGLCANCGYDFRESSERCPECGVAVA